MYINFQQNCISRSVKTVHPNYIPKIENCINLQLPILILKESDYFRHALSYIVHVYQIWVSRSVKTVHTNIFAKMQVQSVYYFNKC